jgi:hypothetical protein
VVTEESPGAEPFSLGKDAPRRSPRRRPQSSWGTSWGPTHDPNASNCSDCSASWTCSDLGAVAARASGSRAGTPPATRSPRASGSRAAPASSLRPPGPRARGAVDTHAATSQAAAGLTATVRLVPLLRGLAWNTPMFSGRGAPKTPDAACARRGARPARARRQSGRWLSGPRRRPPAGRLEQFRAELTCSKLFSTALNCPKLKTA